MPEETGGAALRALLGTRGFVRLWVVGGLSNAMRQFEVLAAALFTLQVTHSVFAVAVVSAARTLPMLLFGALAGMVAEAMDRKAMLLGGQILSGIASASVAALALSGLAHPWQVAVAAAVSGTVWSSEMATRRRMLGESVETGLVSRGMALDSVTNNMMRMAGPLLAGVAFEWLGLGGCFVFSAACYFTAALVAAGVQHQQVMRRLRLSRAPAELAEGLAFARRHPVVAGVLGVTMAMNFFGYSYAALIAPIGRQHFLVSASLVGIMAASEPFGALLGGLFLTSNGPPFSGRVLMVGGAALFLIVEALMPLAPWFGLACLVLFFGGFGTASYSNMQTALIIIHAPPAIRSRVMGLLTVCVGMAPLGILFAGAFAARFGDPAALEVMGLAGFVLVTLIGAAWRQRERRVEAGPLSL